MFKSLALFAVAFSTYAATPVYQATVDNPQNYTVVSGAATPDAAALHNGRKSLRVEPGKAGSAAVRFAPVQLALGKRYELLGWIRTDRLEVHDTDRSPIATGATIAMASMPFDVHASSVGGTKDWTRVSLKFVASRLQDQIVLTAGKGGTFRGTAWFEGVSLDEAGSSDAWPAREAVQRFGPAYRYPAAGWIYLHIEGQPYERGYQHGRLMAHEIPEYLARCAANLGSAEQWNDYRTTANALFLRGFDREILEEMRGIADGASDAGAKWMNRRVDLIDLVVANTTVEMGELRSAVTVTPTGLENFTFSKPTYEKKDSVIEHCSAFAATGPATRDGKMVVGHVTWWPLTLAEQTNVMLDIKPAAGHRVLMQSYPGGIESGTDWYQNDAGVVLTETTIMQTPFNAQGTPVAFRARQAIQYGGNVDEVVKYLGTRNNGLYTNEWLIGDAKTNEVAMYELGTNRTKLWRSSKHEWFGDTPGFYWGNNNAKDLAVRLELLPDPHAAAPWYIPYTPSQRDLKWQELYRAQREDRRAVRVHGLPHGAAGERIDDGREGLDRGYGEAADGVGGVRQAEPAGVAAGRRAVDVRKERRAIPERILAVRRQRAGAGVDRGEARGAARGEDGEFRGEAVDRVGAAGVGGGRIVRGGRGGIPAGAGAGRCREGGRGDADHAARAEARSAERDDAARDRAVGRRDVARLAAAADGRRRVPEANVGLLRGEHDEDGDGAVVRR